MIKPSPHQKPHTESQFNVPHSQSALTVRIFTNSALYELHETNADLDATPVVDDYVQNKE